MKNLVTVLLVGASIISAQADPLPNDRYGTRKAGYQAMASCLKDYTALFQKYYPKGLQEEGQMMTPPKGKGAKVPPQPEQAPKKDPFVEHPDLLAARNKAHACTAPVLEWFFYYGWSKAFKDPSFDADHQDFNQLGYYPTDIFAAMTQRLGLPTAWPKDERDVSDAEKFCAAQTTTYLVRAECYQPLVDWYVERAERSKDKTEAHKNLAQASRLSKPLLNAFHDAIAANDRRPQKTFKERMFKFSRYSEMLEWIHQIETGAKTVVKSDDKTSQLNPHIILQSILEKSMLCAPDDLSLVDTLGNLIDAEISNKNQDKDNEGYLNSKTVMSMIEKYRPSFSEPFELNDRMLPHINYYVKNTPFQNEAEKRSFMKTFKALVDAQTKAFPARILQIEKYAKAFDPRAGLMTAPNTLNSDQLDGDIEMIRRNKDPKYITWVLEKLTQRVHMFDANKIAVEFFSQTDSKGNLIYMGRPGGKRNEYQLKNTAPRAKFLASTMTDKEREEFHIPQASPGAIVIRSFQDLASWSAKTADEIAERPIRVR